MNNGQMLFVYLILTVIALGIIQIIGIKLVIWYFDQRTTKKAKGQKARPMARQLWDAVFCSHKQTEIVDEFLPVMKPGYAGMGYMQVKLERCVKCLQILRVFDAEGTHHNPNT